MNRHPQPAETLDEAGLSRAELDSRSPLEGTPGFESEDHGTDGRPAGDKVDIVEGPIGSATLKEPSEVAAASTGLAAPPDIEDVDATG